MTSLQELTMVSSPFLVTRSESEGLAKQALGWQDSGLVVRAIRGRKSRSLQALFDEFAAALQFPYYFGENWAAFADCVGDLDWLPFKRGVVVLIYDADEVLVDSDPAEMSALVRALASAADDFSEAVEEGKWWDRGPVPFHVVLQGFAKNELRNWRDAGATPAPL